MTIVTSLSSLRILVQAYLDVDPTATTLSTMSLEEEEMTKFHRLCKAIMSIKLTFLFGTFTLLCAWSLTSLLLFHAMIISIAQTTNERVRNVYRASRGFSLCGRKSTTSSSSTAEDHSNNSMTGADNEADQGCCPNWYRSFCSPVPVSRLPPDMSATVVCQYASTTGDETVWTGGDTSGEEGAGGGAGGSTPGRPSAAA